MVPVDHSEYAQSADGLKDANVIGIIDHHANGSVTTKSPLIYDARPLGSAATIVWIRYRNCRIEPYASRKKVFIPAITKVLDSKK